MVCFQAKNPNLGKFWRFLQWKILAKLLTIWSILRPSEIFYGHLVYFVVIRYIFPRFGILYYEKSGNPGPKSFFAAFKVSGNGAFLPRRNDFVFVSGKKPEKQKFVNCSYRQTVIPRLPARSRSRLGRLKFSILKKLDRCRDNKNILGY
jgi:hypothetical protein